MFKDPIFMGSFYALMTTMLWSGNYVVARLAVGKIPPMTLGALRWLVALLILCCFALPKLKKEWPVAKKFMIPILVAGLTAVTLFNPLCYLAAASTSALNLSLISVTTPIFIVIISAMLGEKQPVNTWIGCTIALIGSIYLVAEGQLSRVLGMQFAVGDILMLAAAIGFAVYSMVLRKIPDGLSQSTILTLMVFFGLLMLLPFLGWEWSKPDVHIEFSGVVIFSIIYTGVGNSLIAWWLWNLSLEKAGPTRAGMIYYSMPLLSGVFGYFFLGEAIGVVQLISGILIVGGIIWSSRPEKKRLAAAEAN
ncbi:DMT family transporter [Desulfovibrio sulfodismutans]|uniref:DMT family transporter n=1 Tax=Desulfolutivibrio sulfodismutans TaxID=63561 RepID=A0A7K3NGV0_9BACT|nr:DMT family transporter [Desulfolutivibrio sulfodismutans]NDY55426.1 DMT family transporter [Desulfolutivibrio sulfodismutans]QLA12202.1 EamA family transporter [Desulfolutivibrio sulfodismutans DSM 3696]